MAAPSNPGLDDARNWLQERLTEGVTCPCCGQHAQAYKRKLNAPMVAWLIWLVGEYIRTQDWCHVNDGPVLQHRKGGGDFAKLAHWGMIIGKPNDDPSKRTSGFWAPTQYGVDFVYGSASAWKYLWIYDNRVVGHEPDVLLVKDALEEQFDYAELMGGKSP
jgi:hypothetical protein